MSFRKAGEAADVAQARTREAELGELVEIGDLGLKKLVFEDIYVEIPSKCESSC